MSSIKLILSFLTLLDFVTLLKSSSVSNESIIIGTSPPCFCEALIVGINWLSFISLLLVKSVALLILFISTSATLSLSSNVFSSSSTIGESLINVFFVLSSFVFIEIFNSGISFSSFSSWGTVGGACFTKTCGLFGCCDCCGTVVETCCPFCFEVCNSVTAVGVIFGLAITSLFFFTAFGSGLANTSKIFFSFSSFTCWLYLFLAASAWAFACSAVNIVGVPTASFLLPAASWAFLSASASAWAFACSGVNIATWGNVPGVVAAGVGGVVVFVTSSSWAVGSFDLASSVACFFTNSLTSFPSFFTLAAPCFIGSNLTILSSFPGSIIAPGLLTALEESSSSVSVASSTVSFSFSFSSSSSSSSDLVKYETSSSSSLSISITL